MVQIQKKQRNSNLELCCIIVMLLIVAITMLSILSWQKKWRKSH